MLEDAELLRRYAWEGSQDAFSELVKRRINLVYSVALRTVGGDAHLAQDVTQKVFADLARKARMLAHRPVLTGWLCRGAQFAGSDAVRTERRRRAREQESHNMEETFWTPNHDADWLKVRPLLDRALGELGEVDRDAIALRFFEQKSFAEVGARLRLTEEAARKRVDRALDKLAAGLSRHGVTSTAGALGLALANHVTMAAPAGLASTVTAASLAAGAASAGTGLLAFVGLTTAGKAVFTGLAATAAIATGAAVYHAQASRESLAALLGATRQQEMLQAQVRSLQTDLIAAQARADAAEDDNAKLLTAIERVKGSGVAVTVSPTPEELVRDEIETRYKRGQAFLSDGKWDQALADLLWCFDDGMTRHTAYSGMRLSVLLREIAKIAQHYPPAAAALRERRDRARELVLTRGAADGSAHEFASLNRVLGEEKRTLDLYDQLSPDSPGRRQLVLAGTFTLLVEHGRYRDALVAVPYERMGPWFDRESQPPSVATERYPDMALKRHRRIVVGDAAKNVEVLAGAGDLAHAREFAAKVLAFDNSAETREVLQKHATRAGHPNLFGELMPK